MSEYVIVVWMEWIVGCLIFVTELSQIRLFKLQVLTPLLLAHLIIVTMQPHEVRQVVEIYAPLADLLLLSFKRVVLILLLPYDL